jgi:hypothetical protein
MKVQFYKGVIREESGEEVVVHWAVTRFGISALKHGADDLRNHLALDEVIHAEAVTEVELPGLDKEDADVLVENILRGGYLEKPGVKDSGEAVLFILVNEAINSLAGLDEVDGCD